MNVVTGEEMHQIDRYAIEEIGLKEELLMENAGLAFVNCILPLLEKKTDRVAVLIGVGNNGGDGFVISRSLLEKGYQVDVWLIPPLEKVKGTAKYHMEVFAKCGYQILNFENFTYEHFLEKLTSCTYLIDALLGTGIRGSLRSPYKEIIPAVNKLDRTVISVDLPSGLPSSEVCEVEEAIKATYTVTLQCPKLSAFTYPAREYYGELSVVDIGIPRLAINEISNERFLWTEKDVKRTLPVRKPSSHKGSHGKALIIAGSKTMTGAPVLTTKACHRLGAGLVTLAIPDVAHEVVASQIIEATFHLCSSKNGEINDTHLSDKQLKDRYDAIAVGPGIGRNNTGSFLKTLLTDFQKPIIIDADGLYYLKRYISTLRTRGGATILTPHSGEFAFLINESIKTVEENRFSLSKQFAMQHGVYLLLKGPNTIVTTPTGNQFINPTGNSALAKGGSGDVLTGMVLALVMQQQDLQPAISNAAFLHGKAADILTSHGFSPLSVLASDLVEIMPQVLDRF